MFLVLKKILMWNRKGAWGQQLTIIGWGWAKYRDLSVASRLIIAIIDLWDTDKSQYFAITEFNYHSVNEFVFLMNIWHFAIFTQNWSQEGEKHGFIYAWAECYL